MIPTKRNFRTAAILTAVLFLSLVLGACVTPSKIDELQGNIEQVRADNKKSQQMIARIDSLLTMQSESNDKFRNDVSYTASELQRQMGTLLENYNELMAQLNQISSGGRVTHIVKSSSGATQGTSQTVTEGAPLQPSIDCQKAYDDAFILVRQGEYEKSINEFKKYLVDCESHSSAENARYWMGECYYSLGKFPDAIEQFQMVLDKYKGSANSGRALYKLGRCNQELGKKDEAKKIYQQVIDKFPQTLEAEQSKERLKDIG